jgi:hypothetical protein
MCLDKEFYNRANRAPSFENGKFWYQKNKQSNTGTCPQRTKEVGSKGLKESNLETLTDDFFKTNSKNDDLLDSNLVDNIDVEDEMDEHLNHNINQTGKPHKKRKERLTMK